MQDREALEGVKHGEDKTRGGSSHSCGSTLILTLLFLESTLSVNASAAVPNGTKKRNFIVVIKTHTHKLKNAEFFLTTTYPVVFCLVF